MARKKRKQQNKPNYPTSVHYEELDGEFRLYKVYGKKIVQDPFYICDDLADMINEIEDSLKRWKCSINLKQLKIFINKHNNNNVANYEEPVIFKSNFR